MVARAEAVVARPENRKRRESTWEAALIGLSDYLRDVGDQIRKEGSWACGLGTG